MDSKEKLLEIDIHKKYILMAPGNLNKDARDYIKKMIADWLHDPDQPFLILPMFGWELLKVETPDQLLADEILDQDWGL